MSEPVKRWRHSVTWAGLQICATTMALRDDGEYVLASDYNALEQQCRELEAENARLKMVTNFSEAVACVFDHLKVAACNTSDLQWDERLEDLAEDVIEFAPEYAVKWKDICKLSAEVADLKARLLEVGRGAEELVRLRAERRELAERIQQIVTHPHESKEVLAHRVRQIIEGLA